MHFSKLISLFWLMFFICISLSITASEIVPDMDIKVYYRTVRADNIRERENTFDDYFILKTQESFSAGRGIIRGNQIIEHFTKDQAGYPIANINLLEVRENTIPERSTSRRLVQPRLNCNRYLFEHKGELSLFIDIEIMDEQIMPGDTIYLYTRRVTARNLFSAKDKAEGDHQKRGSITAEEGLYNNGSIKARAIIEFFSDDEDLDAIRVYHPDTLQENMGFLNAMRTSPMSYNGFILNKQDKKAVYIDLIYIKE